MLVHLNRIGCGGTIIGNHHVLSAAHCCHAIMKQVTDDQTRRTMLSIVVNRYDRSTNEGETLRPTKIMLHPKWDSKMLNYDFCLLEFADQNLSDFTEQAACLPQADTQPKVGQHCFVAGWGKLGEKDSVATALQEIRLPVLETAQCNAETSYKESV